MPCFDCCVALLNRWRFTQGFATFTAVAFSVLYTALTLTMLVKSDSQYAFADLFTLDGVKRALATDEVVLPAWVHYVALDLFTAKWQVSRVHSGLVGGMLNVLAVLGPDLFLY